MKLDWVVVVDVFHSDAGRWLAGRSVDGVECSDLETGAIGVGMESIR